MPSTECIGELTTCIPFWPPNVPKKIQATS
jgi:hypothetical protein